MEVVIIDAKVYEELVSKLEACTDMLEKVMGNSSGDLPDEWIDSDDACKRLKVSKRNLQNMRMNGLLPYSYINRKIYYRMGDINDLIEKCRHEF